MFKRNKCVHHHCNGRHMRASTQIAVPSSHLQWKDHLFFCICLNKTGKLRTFSLLCQQMSSVRDLSFSVVKIMVIFWGQIILSEVIIHRLRPNSQSKVCFQFVRVWWTLWSPLNTIVSWTSRYSSPFPCPGVHNRKGTFMNQNEPVMSLSHMPIWMVIKWVQLMKGWTRPLFCTNYLCWKLLRYSYFKWF